jgi:hypothetical protein
MLAAFLSAHLAVLWTGLGTGCEAVQKRVSSTRANETVRSVRRLGSNSVAHTTPESGTGVWTGGWKFRCILIGHGTAQGA